MLTAFVRGLLPGVSECRLDMARYHGETLVEPFSEGVVIALPAGGAVRGLVITAFYFSPGRAGGLSSMGWCSTLPSTR
jgi:hypothetical protein